MTYDEAVEYIHSVSWKGSVPGLSRITELCKKAKSNADIAVKLLNKDPIIVFEEEENDINQENTGEDEI